MSISTSLHDHPIVDNPLQPTGSRDDSPHGVDLPLVDLVAQAPLETPPQFRDWPGLNARFQWANDAGIAHALSSLERAVLRHVCWRAGKREDGRPPGCWESAANIGTALGYHRNHVGRALARLVTKGLLTADRRFHNSTIHRPTFASCTETVQLSQCNPRLHVDATLGCTNKKGKQEGVWAQVELVSGGTLFIPMDLRIVDNDDPDFVDDSKSCGFVGCPFPDRVCPMCGRQGPHY